MIRRRSPATVAATALLLLAGWSGVAALQQSIDRQMAHYQENSEQLWIVSPKVVKALSMGQDGLLAYVYWTRSVQYYGSRLRDRKTDFSQLAPLLHITVSLDPHLLLAYYFGAFFLAEKPPRGAGDPEEAVALLQQGIRANPDEWRLWHHLGFIYYWELQDYSKAAAAYREGAKNPKALDFMKVMAAAILAKGGNLETSRYLWSEIYQTSEDSTIRDNALLHLEAMQARADIEELEKRARLFHDQTGVWPESFPQMIERGLLQQIPRDAAGFPYQLQPNGKVRVDPKSKVIPDFDRTPAPPQTAPPSSS